ncbi:ribosomal protein S18 acetylase RimI-like enzyme [Trinickia symbiotica]|uniref:N-acetyltransferase n=1 Tax=Trinickia symbiotica TaxID=863227 RepID=A0A2N7XAS1_9BURK|nr:GNAT family N-acetyltransferase [Trinickia symbiotica]PMS38711.1 N-acetyltransferase [Trinickia symbiotica]PPK46738.1 ribosomal protein S18 acetylase RimI-like enzyme [Trinickia symbiotica]
MVKGSEQPVAIRRVDAVDLAAMLDLVSQIASRDDLTESARAQFTYELGKPNRECMRLVATYGGAVVGTIGCGPGPIPSKHALWVDWLIVDRSYRRGKIASLLYATIEQFALQLEKSCLCLDIGNIDSERAAYLFHLQNGFQIVGQVPDYWGEFEHLNIMAKFLYSKGR